MKTPVRWLDAGGGAPNGAADLLSAAAPPPPFSDAVRYRLAVGVAKTASVPAASAWTALLAKGAFVAVIGGASGFVVHAVASRHDAPAAPAPAPVTAPRAATVDSTPPVAVEALPTLELPTAAPDRGRIHEPAPFRGKQRPRIGNSLDDFHLPRNFVRRQQIVRVEPLDVIALAQRKRLVPRRRRAGIFLRDDRDFRPGELLRDRQGFVLSSRRPRR